MKKFNKKISLLFASFALMMGIGLSGEKGVITSNAEEVSDILTNSNTINENQTSGAYKNIDETAEFSSGATYKGHMAGQYNSIQMRATQTSSTYYSGLVTVKSGGTIKKVIIEWNSNTSTTTGGSARSVNIYFSNEAYSSPNDLYGSSTHAETGNINRNSTEYTPTGNYTHLGITAKGGAIFLDKITVVWDKTSEGTDPVEKTVTSVTGVAESPKEIYKDSTIEGKDVTLNVSYSDGSNGTEKADHVDVDSSSLGSKTATAYYDAAETMSAEFTVNVIDVPTIPETGTFTLTTGDNLKAISGTFLDGNIEMDCAKNGSSNIPAYYDAGIRFYYGSGGNGGSATFSFKNIIVTKVVLTAAGASYTTRVKYVADEAETILEADSWSGTSLTINDLSAVNSLTIQNANTSNVQLRIKSFEFTYATIQTNPEEPAISITTKAPSLMRVGDELTLEAETKNANDATIEWSVDNSTVASIDANGKVKALAAGKFVATAKINVNGKDYVASTSTITVKDVLVLDHAGTEEDPLSVADALKVCADTGTTESQAYYVKGIVTTVEEISTQYGNATFVISDTKDAENALTLFRIKYLGNTKFTDENQVEVGDEVVCYGALVNYNNTKPEAVQNSYLTKHTAAADLKEEIVWGEEANMLLDKYFYWNDQGWVGSYVAVSEAYLANGTAHFTFKTTWQENECPFGFQAFYKNTSLTVGTEYTLTFDLYSTVECEIQINHSGEKLYHVNAGLNHMSVTYMESGQTSFHIAMSSAYALDADVTLEISKMEWNTPLSAQDKADAFLNDWYALRDEEGSICTADKNDIKAMIERYDALDADVKALVDVAIDVEGNTVKNSIEYLRGYVATEASANAEQTTTGLLLTVAKEHKSAIAIVIALIAATFVGFVVLNKKRKLVK